MESDQESKGLSGFSGCARLLLWVTQIALLLGLFSNLFFFTQAHRADRSACRAQFRFLPVGKNRVVLAVSLLLWTLLVTITYLMYTGDGLRDSAILQCPVFSPAFRDAKSERHSRSALC